MQARPCWQSVYVLHAWNVPFVPALSQSGALTLGSQMQLFEPQTAEGLRRSHAIVHTLPFGTSDGSYHSVHLPRPVPVHVAPTVEQ